MTTVDIMFHTIDDIRGFVKEVSKFNSDVDVAKGSILLDGKSFSGLCSLELNNKLKCSIHDDDEAEDIENVIRQYCV